MSLFFFFCKWWLTVPDPSLCCQDIQINLIWGYEGLFFFFFPVLFVWCLNCQRDTIRNHLGRVWVELCGGIALMNLIDVGRPSPLWAPTLPGLGPWTVQREESSWVHKPSFSLLFTMDMTVPSSCRLDSPTVTTVIWNNWSRSF